MKVTIIYDTKSGNTRRMAEAVGEGAREIEDVEVFVKHVNDAVAEDMLSECVILGSPAWCGLMTWKLKKYLDKSCGTAWNKVSGHIATAFCSSGGLGGGNELTLWSMLNALMNYGYMVFGMPEYSGPGVTAHYGAVAVGNPGELELKACRMLGKMASEHVKRIFGKS